MDGNGSNRFLFYGTKVGTNTTYDDVFFSMRNNSESWTACKTKKKKQANLFKAFEVKTYCKQANNSMTKT